MRTLALAAAVLAIAPAARAVTCTVSTGGLAFGSYDYLSAVPLDSTAPVTWLCDISATVTITLGRGGSSTYLPRKLLSGVNSANYNLYKDTACSLIWGDGTETTSTVTASGTSGSIPAYGRVPPGQPLPVGSYSDAVVVTITF